MSLLVVDALAESAASAVRSLVAVAAAAHGREPLSDAALLRLDGGPEVRHILLRIGDRIAGYAQLARVGALPLLAEVAVDPAAAPDAAPADLHAELLAELLRLAHGQELTVWTHGRDAPLQLPLARAGFVPSRMLYQMRRQLDGTEPVLTAPAGLRIRTFRPGTDETAFLAANAEAFAGIPDQGGWQLPDLVARMAEPWFDPAGFFLAVDDAGAIAGFHWTKLHPPQPLGETYVFAVVPGFNGRGLALPLAWHGLRHLQQRGAETAMLYVDSRNSPALRLYRGLGFTEWDRDVLYRSPPADNASAQIGAVQRDPSGEPGP